MYRNVIIGVATALILVPLIATAEIADGLGGAKGSSGNAKPVVSPHAIPMVDQVATPSNGKVVSVIDGAGYSYIELENGGKHFWIAGTQIAVKAGQNVEFVENVVMEKFTSKTLNKTFDRIVFASSIKILP